MQAIGYRSAGRFRNALRVSLDLPDHARPAVFGGRAVPRNLGAQEALGAPEPAQPLHVAQHGKVPPLVVAPLQGGTSRRRRRRRRVRGIGRYKPARRNRQATGRRGWGSSPHTRRGSNGAHRPRRRGRASPSTVGIARDRERPMQRGSTASRSGRTSSRTECGQPRGRAGRPSSASLGRGSRAPSSAPLRARLAMSAQPSRPLRPR